MILKIGKRDLQKVAVVDDDESVRASYAESLKDLGLDPVNIDGPLEEVDAVWGRVFKGCDAVVTDLMLRGSGYAQFNGGSLAAECRRRGVPAIVCTSYTDVNRQLARSDRRYIAAILPQAQFDHSLIVKGFEKAIDEIEGRFTPERRPWRTQVEVVELSEKDKFMWVIVMGRSPNEKVGLNVDELPPDIQPQITKGKILHALVNTGARNPDDLFFDDWENR